MIKDHFIIKLLYAQHRTWIIVYLKGPNLNSTLLEYQERFQIQCGLFLLRYETGMDNNSETTL